MRPLKGLAKPLPDETEVPESSGLGLLSTLSMLWSGSSSRSVDEAQEASQKKVVVPVRRRKVCEQECSSPPHAIHPPNRRFQPHPAHGKALEDTSEGIIASLIAELIDGR